MASAGAGRFWRSLLFVLVLIGALWGAGVGVHQLRVGDAEEDEPRPALVNLGLDLQGGISVVLTPTEGQGEVDRGSLDKAREIIARRVDGLGVAEPEIALEGSNIIVQLPGVTEARAALDLIGTTAKLTFRPVAGLPIPPGQTDPANQPDLPDELPDCADPTTFPNDDPTEPVVFCQRTVDPQTGRELPPAQWDRVPLAPAALEGADVSSARANLGGGATGGPAGWSVELDLNREGGRKFEEVTGQLACEPLGSPTRQLAIVLDGIIESSPQAGDDVQCGQGIGGGTAVITGNFGESEARDLSLVLRFGALPIELEPATTTTVSPTLGRDSLRGGLLAGAIGLVVVLLYVVVFYRLLGLVVWLGLLLHGTMTLGLVVLLGQTIGFALTLAGIAGLIVSLGIATDSFIVYLERIKDELRHAKGVRAAVERAWAAAWRTILAADFVTALGAVVLYMIAVGSVRGFALMLGIATGLDIIISRLYMHPIVWLLSRTKLLGRNRSLGVRGIAGAEPAPVSGGDS